MRPDLEHAERDGLLLRYGELVDSLRGAFHTGPDLGTSSLDMDLIRQRTGYVSGHSRGLRGAGDLGPFTALGVLFGMLACVEPVFGSDRFAGRRVVVQGAGSVGMALIELSLRSSAEVVLRGGSRRGFRDGACSHRRMTSRARSGLPDGTPTPAHDRRSPVAQAGDRSGVVVTDLTLTNSTRRV